jgi:hypothetical protein
MEKCPGKSGLLYGVLFGVIMVLEFVVMYIIGAIISRNQRESLLTLPTTSLPLVFIYLGCINYKKNLNNGFISLVKV